MLLKYTEAQYGDDITRDPNRKNHLQGCWCIVDRNGVEKFVADSYRSPWLIRNSCLYSIDQNYYNIETKEFYAHAESTIQSKEYLFIKTGYGTPKEKEGVMKIHKETGCWELFY